MPHSLRLSALVAKFKQIFFSPGVKLESFKAQTRSYKSLFSCIDRWLLYLSCGLDCSEGIAWGSLSVTIEGLNINWYYRFLACLPKVSIPTEGCEILSPCFYQTSCLVTRSRGTCGLDPTSKWVSAVKSTIQHRSSVGIIASEGS